MSDTLKRIRNLIARNEVRVSEHGYDELTEDGIFAKDLIEGIARAKLIEDYPEYPKGPCVLVLETDRDGESVHAVWGIPKPDKPVP